MDIYVKNYFNSIFLFLYFNHVFPCTLILPISTDNVTN